MSISLPSVINSVIQLTENKEPESKPLIQMNQVDKIVICISKALSKDEKKLLEFYGRVIEYDHSVNHNIPLREVECAYLLIDLRRDNDRYYLQKFILPVLSEIHLILFKHSWEGDDGMSYECERHELPPKQVSKKEFDLMLVQQPLEHQSCLISLLKKVICVSTQ
jgi:hypothetical protein